MLNTSAGKWKEVENGLTEANLAKSSNDGRGSIRTMMMMIMKMVLPSLPNFV
jgi:hypothetical protein